MGMGCHQSKSITALFVSIKLRDRNDAAKLLEKIASEGKTTCTSATVDLLPDL